MKGKKPQTIMGMHIIYRCFCMVINKKIENNSSEFVYQLGASHTRFVGVVR